MSSRGKQNSDAVLAVLRQQSGPVSAYAVLDELRKSNPKAAPPTVYRALAALTEEGKVHRVESLNAFVACKAAHHRHASMISICDTCGAVEEWLEPDMVDRISALVGQSGFVPVRHVIEVHGRCADCQRDKARL